METVHIRVLQVALVVLALLLLNTALAHALDVQLTYSECQDYLIFVDEFTNDSLHICAPAMNENITYIENITYVQNVTWIQNVTWVQNITVVQNVTNVTYPTYVQNVTWIQNVTIENVTYPVWIQNVTWVDNVTNVTWVQNITNNDSCITGWNTTRDTRVLMPGEQWTGEWAEWFSATCFDAPCVANTTTCPVCEACNTTRDCIQASPIQGATITFAEFSGAYNCTIAAMDAKGQKVCLDDRERYCEFSCQEIRANANATMNQHATLEAATTACQGNLSECHRVQKVLEDDRGDFSSAMYLMGGIGALFLIYNVMEDRRKTQGVGKNGK